MSLSFAVASTEDDAREIVALHAAAAGHRRTWKVPELRRVVAAMTTTTTLLARDGPVLAGSCRLDPSRGYCGVARFTEVPRFVYLLEMVVHPAHRRCGVGRACLREAERVSRSLGALAIRLDTNDDGAGASTFYEACGYRQVLHHAQTIYLERLL